MAELPADRDLEVLLDYLRRSRGFDFTGYKRTSLTRRIDKRMQEVGVDGYAELPGPPRGPPRGVRPAVQHHPDQRDRLLPRPAGLGVPERRGPARLIADKRRRRADPRLERRLRLGRGGVHAGHAARRGAGARAVPRAGQDLRHRRRRGGAQPGPPGRLHGQAGRGRPAGAAGAVLRAQRRRLRVPQGPAARGDLRPPRPDPGRADLAHRPAGLPQHPDVLQRRDPGAGAGPLHFALREGGYLLLGKAEMLLGPLRPVRAGGPEAPGLPEGPGRRPCASA